MLASALGHNQIVTLLLDRGANLHAIDEVILPSLYSNVISSMKILLFFMLVVKDELKLLFY